MRLCFKFARASTIFIERKTEELSLTDINSDKSVVDNKMLIEIVADQGKIHDCLISSFNQKTIEFNSATNKQQDEMFYLIEQKLQPYLDNLQKKKKELRSISKDLSSSCNGIKLPRKSILNNVPSKPVTQLSTDILLTCMDRQRQNELFQASQSLETTWIKTTVNNANFSSQISALHEVSSADRSISAIKRSHSSLPFSKSAVRISSESISVLTLPRFRFFQIYQLFSAALLHYDVKRVILLMKTHCLATTETCCCKKSKNYNSPYLTVIAKCIHYHSASTFTSEAKVISGNDYFRI